MVIFVNSKEGFDELNSLIISGNYPTWVNFGVLSQSKINALRDDGIDLTEFNPSINIENNGELNSAIETIKEHYPEERIWIEKI